MVSGNPQSNAGWSDIAMFNNATYKLEDNTYPGFSHLSKFYVVRIEKSSVKGLHGNMIDTSKVIYTLVMNNVRSAAATRNGRLKISFSIPKGYRLAGNVTPKQVMDDLEKSFTEKCMTLVDSDNLTREFNAGIIDSDILDEVGYRYPLESYEGPFRAMTPQGPVGYIETGDMAHLEAAMADMQYEELSGFKEVILAESSYNCSLKKIDVEIPRRPLFSIISMISDRSGRVKVEKNSKALKDPDMEIYIPAPMSADPYFKYEPVRFTLNELEKTPSPKVAVDRAAETITVFFTPVPITKEYRFEVKPADSATLEYLKEHKLELCKKNGNTLIPIKIKDGKFELTGTDNKYFESNQIDVNIPLEGGYRIYKQLISDAYTSQVILDVKITPPANPKPPVVIGQPVVSSPVGADKDSLIPLTVIIENPNLIKDAKFVRISIREYELLLFQTILCKKLGQPWFPDSKDQKTIVANKMQPGRQNSTKVSGKREGKNNHSSSRNTWKISSDFDQNRMASEALSWRIGVPYDLVIPGRNREVRVSTKDWSFRAYELSKQNNYTVIVPAEAEELSNFVKESKTKRWFKKFWSFGVMALLAIAVIVLVSIGKFSKNSALAERGYTDTVPNEEIVELSPVDPALAAAQTSISSGITVIDIVEFSPIIDKMISGKYSDNIPLDSIDVVLTSSKFDSVRKVNPDIEKNAQAFGVVAKKMNELTSDEFIDYLKTLKESKKINFTENQIDNLIKMKENLEEKRRYLE